MASDDPTLDDELPLWRRIPPQFVKDLNTDTVRPTSQAFQNLPGKMAFSVWISSVARAHNGSPDDLVAGHEGYGAVEFTAGTARELGQAVSREPEPDQPAHGHVTGRKSRKTRSEFAKRSAWLIKP